MQSIRRERRWTKVEGEKEKRRKGEERRGEERRGEERRGEEHVRWEWRKGAAKGVSYTNVIRIRHGAHNTQRSFGFLKFIKYLVI